MGELDLVANPQFLFTDNREIDGEEEGSGFGGNGQSDEAGWLSEGRYGLMISSKSGSRMRLPRVAKKEHTDSKWDRSQSAKFSLVRAALPMCPACRECQHQVWVDMVSKWNIFNLHSIQGACCATSVGSVIGWPLIVKLIERSRVFGAQ